MPTIRNYLHAPKQARASSHGGQGPVDLYEIWEGSDFKSDVDFMVRVVVPPGSNIGYHQHGANEEMYVVLDGQGTMTVDGEPTTVKKGDMIFNRAFGQHGLVNDSNADIDLLVIQINLDD